jgi:release factor glutamine methyltransferase
LNTQQPKKASLLLSRLVVAGSRHEDSARTTAPGPCHDAAPFPFVWSLDRSSTVGRALLAASRRLREAGSDTPQLDSAVLMAHVLGVGKTWLYAHPNRPMSEDEIGRFEKLVRRRMGHEPVAYLVGYRSFFGLDITVDNRVLVPRPETELLVERALAYIKQLVEAGQKPRVADVGTGSGAIAVALAVNAPRAMVYATDISDGALEVAASNIWRYGVGEQVQVLPGYLMDGVPEPVDVVVANLPYVATGVLPSLPCEVRDFEPTQALDGGPDGLGVVRALLESLAAGGSATGKLRPGGRIFLEIGAGQGAAAKAIAQALFPASQVESLVDYAGIDRIITVAG